MLKKQIILFAVLLFLFPLISSVEVNINEEFNQGETLLATISGNFLKPLLEENIFFYRGHVRVPMEYSLAIINDEFYLYALLPENEGNYSLVIDDVKYMKGKEISEENITRNFIITSNSADFSVEPGFIVTNKDFYLTVQNLQEEKIDINVDVGPNSTESFSLFSTSEETFSTSLKSGETKKINFNVEEVNSPSFLNIRLSSDNLEYNIPTYIYTNKTDSEKSSQLKFDPSSLNVSLVFNDDTSRTFFLINKGDEIIEDVSLEISNSISPYVSLSTNEISEIETNSSIKLNLEIEAGNTSDSISGNIKASFNDTSIYFPIYLNFVEEYTSNQTSDLSKTCSELGGEICTDDQDCDGDLQYAKDDLCCLGTCKEKESSNLGTIIGWSLLVLIIGFLVWFFLKRSKKTKKPFNLLNVAKKGTSGDKFKK